MAVLRFVGFCTILKNTHRFQNVAIMALPFKEKNVMLLGSLSNIQRREEVLYA